MSDSSKSFIETWIRSVAEARGETRPFDWFFRDVCSFEPPHAADIDDPYWHFIALFVPLRMAADAVFNIRQLRQMSSGDYATALLIAIGRELHAARGLRAAMQRRNEPPASMRAVPLMCIGLVVIGRQEPTMNDLIGGRHALLHDAEFQLAAMQLAITPDVREVAVDLAAGVDETIARALGQPLSPASPQAAATGVRPPWPAPAAPAPTSTTARLLPPSAHLPQPQPSAPAADDEPDRSLRDSVEDARAKGVTTISFTVFRGMVLGMRDEPEGLVIDLTGEVLSFVARNAVGTVVGAGSDARDLISFQVPTVLLNAGVEVSCSLRSCATGTPPARSSTWSGSKASMWRSSTPSVAQAMVGSASAHRRHDVVLSGEPGQPSTAA